MRFVGLIGTMMWLAAAAACGSADDDAARSSNGSSGSTAASAATGSGGASSSTTTANGGSTAAQGGQAGDGAGGSIDKAANCTDQFGTAMTAGFGRLDGTMLAVLKPTDTQCPMPNSDHVVLEVVMGGAAYRMVVNVQSTIGDPNVDYLTKEAPLPSPAWADGWHLGVNLDYIATLGVHSGDFAPHPMAELSDMIADAIDLNAPVSVYATTSGGTSAHLIHKNDGTGVDGAIVLDPAGASPHWLLFHFADQTF